MTTEEDSLIYRHRLMWAQDSKPLRAECVHCGQELEQDHLRDWKSKETGLELCQARY